MTVSNAVLLIEDDPDDASLVRAWLESTRPGQFHIEQVSALEDARVLMSEGAFDAAIVGFHLRDAGGVDTVIRFRRACASCPIVLLTHRGDEREASAALELGADEIVSKDAGDPAQLAAALDRAIARHDRHSRHQALAERLRRRLLRAEQALDGHSDAMVVFDDEGRVLYANFAADSILGLRVGGQVPTPLCDDRRGEWTGTLAVGGPSESPLVLSVTRRPLLGMQAHEAILVARMVDPAQPTRRLHGDDARVLARTAEALVQHATELLRRTAALAISTDDLVVLPIATHMVTLDMLRLAIALRETTGAPAEEPA